MGNFDRGNRGGGRDFRRDSGRGGFGGDRGGDRQMHQAVCSNCGKNCEVPFKPTGSKPVFCSDCFKTMGGGDRDRRPEDRGGERRPSFSNRSDSGPRTPSDHPQYKDQFETLNAKLDKIIAKLYSENPSETLSKNKKTEEEKVEEVILEPETVEFKPSEEVAPVVKMKKRVTKKAAPVPPQNTESPIESASQPEPTPKEIS